MKNKKLDKIVRALEVILALLDKTMPMAGVYTDTWENSELELKDLIGQLKAEK